MTFRRLASRVILVAIALTALAYYFIPQAGPGCGPFDSNGVKLATIIVLAVAERIAIRRGW